MTRKLFTDDFIVYRDQQFLGIVKDAKVEDAAMNSFNATPVEREGKPARKRKADECANRAVRIRTVEGTMVRLIQAKDPVTLRWARDGKSADAKRAREIAKELGVKLPKKPKESKKEISTV